LKLYGDNAGTEAGSKFAVKLFYMTTCMFFAH